VIRKATTTHHFLNEPRLTFAENQSGALEGAAW
jgi:hypothetical protein